jgi:ABC-type branched-subunit amino acid transport system ATPase component
VSSFSATWKTKEARLAPVVGSRLVRRAFTPGRKTRHAYLLLLDEPSLGLAPLVVRAIFGTIKELHAAGVTILLVEQNAHAALEIADRGYVLEAGRLAMSGPAASLLTDDRVRRAYLG